MRAIIDRHKNRNGCNAPATFFVLYLGTDCALARKFWEENSEVGGFGRGGVWGAAGQQVGYLGCT